jgi:hypothetical protein
VPETIDTKEMHDKGLCCENNRGCNRAPRAQEHLKIRRKQQI